MKIKFKKLFLHPNNQLPLVFLPKWLFIRQSALLKRRRSYSCKNCWATSDLSQSFSLVDLSTGGWAKTSTRDVTTKVPPSPFLRWNMGTASAVSPMLSGHVSMTTLVILVRCCLTCRANVNSLSRMKRWGYIAIVTSDHILVMMSYLYLNHSIVIISASQKQIKMVTRSLSKMGRTCWLTRRVESSQSPS